MRRHVTDEDTGRLARELFLDRTGLRSGVARGWARGVLTAWSKLLPRRVPPRQAVAVLMAPAVLLDMLLHPAGGGPRWLLWVVVGAMTMALLSWFSVWLHWGTLLALGVLAVGGVLAWRDS